MSPQPEGRSREILIKSTSFKVLGLSGLQLVICEQTMALCLLQFARRPYICKVLGHVTA